MTAALKITGRESTNDLREHQRVIKEGLEFLKTEVDWLNMAHAALQIAKADPAQRWSANDLEKEVKYMMKEAIDTYNLLKMLNKQLDKRIYL